LQKTVTPHARKPQQPYAHPLLLPASEVGPVCDWPRSATACRRRSPLAKLTRATQSHRQPVHQLSPRALTPHALTAHARKPSSRIRRTSTCCFLPLLRASARRGQSETGPTSQEFEPGEVRGGGELGVGMGVL